MSELKDILIYIINSYPNKNELSNARLTKIVYLCDWYNLVHHNSQVSSIRWYFDNYGPFVWDIYNEASSNDAFKIEVATNYFGTEKKIISLKTSNNAELKDDEMHSINKVIDATKNLNWSEFINLVYSTYPILTSEKYTHLNLKNKLKEFKKT